MKMAAIAPGLVFCASLAGCAPDPAAEDGAVELALGGRETIADGGAHDSEGERAGASQSALVAPPVGLLPSPEDVYIESIATGGSGCPSPTSVTTQISSDRTTFLLIFDEMILENPPAPAVKNINCTAGIQLHIPSGWQFSVATVDTRGYAYLSPGIRARQTSKYFFAGIPLGASYHATLVGLHDDIYAFTDTIPFESVVWSPCGGSAIFAIDTSLNLNAVLNPTGLAYFNAETVDGSFQKVLHWTWQPC